MIEAKVYVTLKESILDPQGKVVMQTLHNLGYESVVDVRISKYMVIRMSEKDPEEAARKVEEFCRRVLVNPNTETFRYELTERDE